MRITAYAVHRRLATGAIALALIVLGVYGLLRLPVDYLPEVTYPLVKVSIRWQGATPGEIDKDIADPLERLMATVDNLDAVESSCREGLYSLDVRFAYGTDVDVAFQDVLAVLTRARGSLPDDIDEPFAFKADPSQLPVMQVAVSSERLGPVGLREWADNWLQDRILSARGAAGTEVTGGLEREIRIRIDPVALEKHGLALRSVLTRLAAENVEQTGGRLTVGRQEIIARTTGEFESLDEIRNVVLIRRGERKLYLRDIAEVTDGHEDARVVTRLNGRPCVKVSVFKEAEANTVKVARAVERTLNELAPAFPEGVELSILENQADYVEGALAGVRGSAIQAMILLVVVVYLFLGSVRQVAVMAIAMPLTLLINFGLMKVAGFSLNIFSLGGLVVAIGVVLDNSLVVVENITRLRGEKPNQSIRELIVDAAGEVGPAIVAATVSFLALFVPFLLVPGLTSLLFRELILVIAGIVVVSLGMAVFLTPMISTLFLGHIRTDSANGFERAYARFADLYEGSLRLAVRGRWLVLLGFVSLLALAVLLLGSVGGEFLPLVDDGRVMVKVKLPTGASVAETDKALARIEKMLEGDPLIASTLTLAGGQVKGLTTYEIANEGQIDIQLVPKGERSIGTGAYVQSLRPKIGKIAIPGGMAMVRQLPIKGIHGMRAADVIVKVRGQDMETLADLSRRTAETLNGMGRFQNVNVSMDLSRPEYRVRVDRVKAAELGISVSDVAWTLRSLVTGAVASRYREGGEYYDIRAVVPEERLTARRDVEDLVVARIGGGEVRVRDVAEVVEATGPVEIVRENQVRQITVEADAAGADLASAVAILRETLAGMDVPAGYAFDFGGSAEMMADMREVLFAVLGFAVFFSFIVLTVQFNSVSLPALILASAPFCMTGLVFGLYLAGLSFGATVLIGILVVLALTVNDGVLLLTFARELREDEGLDPVEAVCKAGKIRLRPRLMTTVTTMIGFVPLALNLGEGADMLQPMAVGAIGGLATEAIGALFLMPCMYVILSRNAHRQ